jgi:hypothetical protein
MWVVWGGSMYTCRTVSLGVRSESAPSVLLGGVCDRSSVGCFGALSHAKGAMICADGRVGVAHP